MNARDLWMLGEIARDDHSGGALPSHAQFERLHAANQQEGRFGIHRAPEIYDHVAYFPHQGIAAGRGASDHVGVAGEILGRAVQHNIEAHLKGFLEHRAGERVVDQRDQIPLFREGDRFSQIHEPQSGIRGCFDIQRFRAWTNQAFDSREV